MLDNSLHITNENFANFSFIFTHTGDS